MYLHIFSYVVCIFLLNACIYRQRVQSCKYDFCIKMCVHSSANHSSSCKISWALGADERCKEVYFWPNSKKDLDSMRDEQGIIDPMYEERPSNFYKPNFKVQ